MKVSVIIPSFNEEKYIPYTLFHILQQKPYEVIVADSYSTDKTKKIAEKMGAKVISCPKSTPAAGRNAGAGHAKGDIFLFLDADTIAYYNLLDVMKKDFKKKNVIGWTTNFYAFSSKWIEHELYYLTSKYYHFVNHSVKFPQAPGIVLAVRKDVFKKINGFNEKMKVNEDIDFAKRTRRYGRFIFSDETCVFTSTRRMQKWGVKKMLEKNILEHYLAEFLLKRSKNTLHKEYEDVR